MSYALSLYACIHALHKALCNPGFKCYINKESSFYTRHKMQDLIEYFVSHSVMHC